MAITAKDNLVRERKQDQNPEIKVGINADGRGYLIRADKVKTSDIEIPEVVKPIKKSKRSKK